MNRRTYLAALAAATFTSRAGSRANNAHAAEAVAAPRWRQFEISTHVTLHDTSGPARLWLPLAQTAGGYQTALSLRWEGTGQHEIVRDAVHGAAMLRSSWNGGTGPCRIDVVQTVATRDRDSLPLLPLNEAERRFWTAPTPSAPTDGIVRETAERIVAGRNGQRERLRAIYDWVVDTTWRDPKTPGCGLGYIKSMLETQNFGGKCADINGLMVGLARAAGFPARDLYGVRVAASNVYPSLGRSGDISKAQHCRAEVFLEDEGWFPVDPADVRKVVLEEKLAIDSPEVRALRDRLFGHWEMNWVGYNSATDIELPGSGRDRSNFAFLMYPCAITATGQPDALDPANFQYEIISKEITS